MAVDTPLRDERSNVAPSPSGTVAADIGSSARWGAIISGGLIALATQLLLTLLGSGIGLTAFDPEQGESLGQGAAIGAGIYLFISMIISFFVGGYVASRLAGPKFRMPAGLHGLTAWAGVMVFYVFMVGTGIGNVLGTAFNLAGSVAKPFASTVAQSAGKGQAPGVGGGVQQQGQGQGVDLDALAKTLAQRLNIPESRARNLVNRAMREGQVTSREAQDAAGTAANVSASVSWVAFFAMLFGAIASILGALLGNQPLPSNFGGRRGSGYGRRDYENRVA